MGGIGVVDVIDGMFLGFHEPPRAPVPGKKVLSGHWLAVMCVRSKILDDDGPSNSIQEMILINVVNLTWHYNSKWFNVSLTNIGNHKIEEWTILNGRIPPYKLNDTIFKLAQIDFWHSYLGLFDTDNLDQEIKKKTGLKRSASLKEGWYSMIRT